MRASKYPITAIVSASELFSRFITLATFDDKTANECKELMLHRGQMFLRKLLEARNIIAKQCAQFVTDGCVSEIINGYLERESLFDIHFSHFFSCSFIFIAGTHTCSLKSGAGNINFSCQIE